MAAEQDINEGDSEDSTATSTGANEESQAVADSDRIAELQGQVELVQAENERLRQEYARAQQTKYRRTAIGLILVGLVSIIGAVLFPNTRDVLIALGGSATIAGILTYYLTPEKFVVATVGETLTETIQSTYDTIRSELDLQGEPVYVPVGAGNMNTRLFLPQQREYTLPDDTALTDMFVISDDPSQWGIAVRPSGAGLFEEFKDAAIDFAAQSNDSTDEPIQVFEQLADGLVEQFELADQVTATIEDENRCVLAVTESTYAYQDKIDHPIPSFIAVGAATAFDEPTHISVEKSESQNFIIECRWGSTTDTNLSDEKLTSSRA